MGAEQAGVERADDGRDVGFEVAGLLVQEGVAGGEVFHRSQHGATDQVIPVGATASECLDQSSVVQVAVLLPDAVGGGDQELLDLVDRRGAGLDG
ncbi:hypothetical protein LP422_08670 [Janibacter limosus]|uniref:Uncharacterized protein n=1 Tax=Janibacter limosus TaxID=53458 RepID=A0AC61U925_9MICO|nr:hypothetical protein [Janibacter limosus]UUZ46513.1 hypothetical protein LP422_08670 [Janibacter limosus]